MYGKIFDSMYEGTLHGHWQAIVTLQQMLVLCSSEGVIDMTPQAISARTSIPIEIITKGISDLESPDPHSRTPGVDGRRIVLIDDHRPWGWMIVNYAKYQKLRSREEKLQADRERIAERRKELKNNDVASRSNQSQPVAEVAPKATPPSTPKPKDKSKSNGRAIALPGWLPAEPWEAWLEVRKKLRAPNTDRALRLAIADLEKLRSAGQDPAAVLDQATKRGWRGIFPLAAASGERGNGAGPKPRVCAYCGERSNGNANGYEHCPKHQKNAIYNEVPQRVAT